MKTFSFSTVAWFAMLFFLVPVSVEALPYSGSTPGNKLTASDAAAGDVFGYCASDGNFLIVGALSEDGAGTDRGAAYVFNTVTGEELFKLTPDDPADNDFFGGSVAVSGNLALVGAFGKDSSEGAAYLFDLTTGDQVSKIVASDGEANDQYGGSVAISGNIAVVSGNGSGSNNFGAAYVYDITDPMNPVETFILTASDAGSPSNFGASTALSGHLAIVGASQAASNNGAAYVFDVTTGNELFKLTASDGESGDQFGTSVTISGNTAVVGASGESGNGGINRGAIYVYNLTTGNETFKLTPDDTTNGQLFGTSAALHGNLAVVGATGDGGMGAIYTFDVAAGEELFKYISADGAANDQLGRSVAVSGNTVFGGALFKNSNTGAAYAFRNPTYRPDNLIGPRPFSGIGNDRYNTSGRGQLFRVTSRKLRPATGWATITNDGDAGDNYDVAASRGKNGKFAVTYFRHSGGSASNISAALLAGNHEELNVVGNDPGRRIRIFVRPSRRLKKRKKGKTVYLRKTFTTRVSSTSQTLDFRKDAVLFQVKTR